MELWSPNNNLYQVEDVGRVIVRNKEGVVVHDWGGFFSSVRITRGNGRILLIEYQDMFSQMSYSPSTADSVEIVM